MPKAQRKASSIRNPLSPLKKSIREWGVTEFLASLDTPRALAVKLLYESGEHDQLLALSFPEAQTADRFHRDYLATKLLSKSTFLKLSVDKAAVAMESFWSSERRCSQTNRFLRKSFLDTKNQYPAVHALFQSVQRKIGMILGPFPGEEFFEERGLGWSKGSTSAVNGRSVSPPNKYQARLDTTSGAAGTALKALRHYDLWSYASLNTEALPLESSLTIVRGNKLQLVPKSAKTDRVICVEPHCNIWLQRTVGSYIRKRLKYSGVDLSDQTVNQVRAREGSITGSLATLDLKAASDTISYELVRQLLPDDWFTYLDKLRSPFTEVDGKWVRLEKFSSMGNGYTFELESLIFYSVCACFTHDVTVYGDDIVIDSTVAATAVKALEICGFDVNTSKSFLSGPFRESCGGDYYNGVKVSPVYLRGLDTVGEWINFHNRIRERALFSIELLQAFRRKVPGYLGCVGYGDYHYHVNFDEASPTRHRNSWDGYVHKTFLARPVRNDLRGLNGYALLAAALGPGSQSRDMQDALMSRLPPNMLAPILPKEDVEQHVEWSDILRGRYTFTRGHVFVRFGWQDVLWGVDFY